MAPRKGDEDEEHVAAATAHCGDLHLRLTENGAPAKGSVAT